MHPPEKNSDNVLVKTAGKTPATTSLFRGWGERKCIGGPRHEWSAFVSWMSPHKPLHRSGDPSSTRSGKLRREDCCGYSGFSFASSDIADDPTRTPSCNPVARTNGPTVHVGP
jgi:hypothetical protein